MRIVICFFSGVFMACHTVYVPNGRNSPMFSTARELQVVAALTTGDYASGLSGKNMDFDFQTAFALSDHIGLMGNYSFTDEGRHFVHPALYRHHWFGEGGIGYYKNTGNICSEIFAGFGRGYGNSTHDDTCSATIPDPDTHYVRFFLQPALGLRKPNHHLALASRLSIVNFLHYGQAREPLNIFFIEPAVLGRFNALNGYLFVQWHAGISITVSNVYPEGCMDHVPFNFGLGIGGRLGAFKN